MKVDLVVTRHSGTLEFLKELNLCDSKTLVKAHVTAQDVEDKNVLGVLPHHLSCLCDTFTELHLDVPEAWRGKELSCEEIRQIYRGYTTYEVRAIAEDRVS